MFGEKVRGIDSPAHLVKFDVTVPHSLLGPQIVDGNVPGFAKPGACCYPLCSFRIGMDIDADINAHVPEHCTAAELNRGGLYHPVVLSLTTA